MKRGFLSGFLTALVLLVLIGTTSATIGRRTVDVDYNNINVTLNGEAVELVDANGNPVEPFAINGTTYLPVRAVSAALGLDVDWDSTTSTVVLEGSISSEQTVGAIFYPDFSVPALDNIVGSDAFLDLYLLDSGDSIAYYYDPSKITKTNYISEYGALLELCGFELDPSYTLSDACYVNEISNTSVLIDTGNVGRVVVLVINLADSKSDIGSTSTPGITTPQFPRVSFPLHLYSNDGSVYLGKLVTDKYDRDSIWYEYGSYGSQYSSESIWNKYGTYGSSYSSESAFNEYASNPPVIVDSDGNFFGYLTTNQYTSDGYTIFEIQQFLLENNQ